MTKIKSVRPFILHVPAHPACEVLEYIPWIKDCFTDPAEVVDGYFARPRQPGAGTTPTADAWRKFRQPTA